MPDLRSLPRTAMRGHPVFIWIPAPVPDPDPGFAGMTFLGPDPDTVLTIEFGKYSSILKRVEKLADEEMGPVELQVIYMLKHALTDWRATLTQPWKAAI